MCFMAVARCFHWFRMISLDYGQCENIKGLLTDTPLIGSVFRTVGLPGKQSVPHVFMPIPLPSLQRSFSNIPTTPLRHSYLIYSRNHELTYMNVNDDKHKYAHAYTTYTHIGVLFIHIRAHNQTLKAHTTHRHTHQPPFIIGNPFFHVVQLSEF